MNLHIVTPLEIVVSEAIQSLRAEDETGCFGILPGHADFLTSLAISVVRWTTDARTSYCAVRGGVLSVTGGTQITIATREAITSTDLATLDQSVLSRIQSEYDQERIQHVESTRLQLLAIRQMIGRLNTDRRESVR